MNKFLKKKAVDGPTANDDALRALSQPTSPTLKKSSASRWKKSKKPEPAPRPELDVAIALPSTDDFRTSLLMPSLSTRFSMLREQDDPNSLLGKASDDSVLQPRRRSRMGDFGFSPTGLADIAEVSSIHGSVRRPFAKTNSSRADSSCMSEEGYGSEADAPTGGSVMSRSRPGEGNVLFGGRQKIYKIAGSGVNSTKSLGRLVYDDDVGMSAFQKYRQRERDFDESELPRPSDESQGFDFGLDKVSLDYQDYDGQQPLPNDSAKDLCHSPSLSAYEKKRSTTSSDARSIARSSTAATSVASQTPASTAPSPAHAPSNVLTLNPAPTPPLDRSTTKTRRLYEHGLDQHLQEQQSTAMSRLNSIQRQRAMSGKNAPPFLHSTKSAGNLQDRSQSAVLAFRAQSPAMNSPMSTLTTFGSVKHANSATSSPLPSGPQSPIEGAHDQVSVLAQALEPADRGKATAMGAFNKPAHAFDEHQYLERQKQLQRSASSAAVKTKELPQSALQQRVNAIDQISQDQTNKSPDLSTRARSQSAPRKHEASKAYNVFQNAVNQFPAKPSPPPANKSPLPDTHRTFFGNISASDDEDDEEVSEIAHSFMQPEYGYGGYHSKWQPTILPSVSEHPAMRNSRSQTLAEEEEEDEPPKALKNAQSSRSLKNIAVDHGAELPKPLDSPTLGPDAHSMSGMNGMVHHLRQRSNQSSVYPTDEPTINDDEVPNVPEMPWNARKTDSYGHVVGGALDPLASLRDSHYTASNPWDLDEAPSLMDRGNSSQSDMSPVDASRQSDISQYQETMSSSRPTLTRDGSELTATDDELPSWQRELRRQHTRDASTATQEGRDAFSRELAARREAVKENLRSVVEVNNGSRSASPVPPPLSIPGNGSNGLRAFGMLRAKTSRESLAHMREHPSKALKTLGVANNPSMNNLMQGDRNGHSLDMVRPRENSSARAPMPPTSQHPAFKNDPQERSEENRSSELPRERQLASSRSAAQLNGRNRSRSNSAATNGRSRSRTGPYRDDLEKAMIEGHGSSATAHEFSPDGSPALPPSDRSSDGSRSGMQAYFDQKNGRSLHSVNTQIASSGPSPATAPSTLVSNVYTPGRPVPVANAYSENPTPPIMGSSPALSPVISPTTFAGGVPFPARGAGLRKRTITKHDISEPTLISSTSNVDTVDLPPGASLKNGMEDAPRIPPINPRRRGTRKMFGLGSKEPAEPTIPQATRSDPNLLLQTSPKREAQIMPGNVMRLQAFDQPQFDGLSPTTPGSPEQRVRGPGRAVTAPMEGGMF
ncbi:hypothetical protein Slin14017_G090230 [Septoria linicola]|nr:hypothetical protein Slin14017_G090230 [Septoria linicola]